MHNYKTLKVWSTSIDLTAKVYLATNSFPKSELFGITSQINRCAVSIPSNIAEGAGRNSEKEFDHFLSIALGSSFELETQLIISKDLGFLNQESYAKLMEDLEPIQKMIYGLKKKLGIRRFKRLRNLLMFF